MRPYTFLIPATLLLLLFHAAPAFAAAPYFPTTDPARALALDQSKAEAASLLERGEASKAYDLYMRLLRLAPDDDEVNFGLARAATMSL